MRYLVCHAKIIVFKVFSKKYRCHFKNGIITLHFRYIIALILFDSVILRYKDVIDIADYGIVIGNERQILAAVGMAVLGYVYVIYRVTDVRNFKSVGNS